MNALGRTSSCTSPAYLRSIPYLPGMSFGEFLEHCLERHPVLHDCIDLSGFSEQDLRKLFSGLDSMPAHFESRDAGGRGEAYREGQNRYPLLRARGITKLFELLKQPRGMFLSADIVVDVLGGNGTLTRAMRILTRPEAMPTIITSDASSSMIADAISQYLPAIRQPAQNLLLRDCSIDGAIFAYGTHHIAPETRVHAFGEAYRVLKPGGKAIIQDFEENTPTARWYSEVLDRYTLTGHKCQHFTREGLLELVRQAGFEAVEIVDVYDPFIISGRNPNEARQNLIDHVCSLFALEKLLIEPKDRVPDYWRKIEELFYPYGTFLDEDLPVGTGAIPHPAVHQADGEYLVEFPRIALVAVATKAPK